MNQKEFLTLSRNFLTSILPLHHGTVMMYLNNDTKSDTSSTDLNITDFSEV